MDIAGERRRSRAIERTCPNCYVSPLDWSGLLTGYDYGPRFIISHGLVIRWRITCTILTHSWDSCIRIASYPRIVVLGFLGFMRGFKATSFLYINRRMKTKALQLGLL